MRSFEHLSILESNQSMEVQQMELVSCDCVLLFKGQIRPKSTKEAFYQLSK